VPALADDLPPLRQDYHSHYLLHTKQRRAVRENIPVSAAAGT
jgi:hypothetical protein